jgi:hypothetical protein
VYFVSSVSCTRFLHESVEFVRCILEMAESDFIAPFSFDEGSEENIWT